MKECYFNYSSINIFRIFKLHKWYQIAQNVFI